MRPATTEELCWLHDHMVETALLEAEMILSSPTPSKSNLAECPNCAGEGFTGKIGRCTRCNGSGRLVVRETSEGNFKETSLLLD